MSGQPVEELAPPGNLRPAQLGIVLVGRVIAGHLGATLADLCQRGFLSIEQIPGDDEAQWLLTDLRGQASGPGGPLLPFETALLDGLFGLQAQARVPGADTGLLLVLDRVREELRRDAVRHGWLRRWRQDRRTRQGEQLLRQIQAFRQGLRALVLSGAEVPAALAPYMMIFGLAVVPGTCAGINEPAVQRSSELQWVRLDLFAATWNAWVGESCGNGAHGGNSRPDDFTHQWHVPNGHNHMNPGHHSGRGGYDGHGSFDSGLGSHAGGGHGGGHGGH